MCIPLISIVCHFFHLSSTHLFILIAMPIFHSNPHYPSVFPASWRKIIDFILSHLCWGTQNDSQLFHVHASFSSSLIWPYLLFQTIPQNQAFALIDRSSHFFSACITCLFLNLCFCFYEFIFSESMSHISLNLPVLPYLPKIAMFQTPSKQLFPSSHRFLFLILLSFVLSGKKKGLLIATSTPFTAKSK